MQRAADAAALAGAGNLPDVNDAVVAARDWSGENGYVHGQGTVSVQVTTPYGGDADKIEVVIQGKMPTTFLGVLGIVDTNVTARAVAERTAGGGGSYAIFANNSGCPGNDTLEVSGSTNAIDRRCLLLNRQANAKRLGHHRQRYARRSGRGTGVGQPV